MSTTKEVVNTIIEAIQEKKGHSIVVADLRKIITAPCEYFVVATGNSPQHVSALTDSVEEMVRVAHGEKPAAIAGQENAIWEAMDYGNIMVHHLLPDAREHYDIEHLWQDAHLEIIPDLD
jgi:ribosome-associated protein